ncbi:MAG TPA: imidazoleglycerol-phosphate dehydratase HisB [Myxococcales bacterium LLY-WYZ-16_1]|jgi:imidazoleglycerol-phosphate dehydratase|nr:imidazoleglycerol-phosphate dehydratase HisB [Myxococcales bacterium LLY-WYZ-16_1]
MNDASSRRFVRHTRSTRETEVSVELDLDGAGRATAQTGLGFLDHMVEAFGHHGRFDLQLEAKGDLHIDDHHLVEDCALTLGQAFDRALASRSGIRRFGWCLVPMDEALVRVAWDLSGRPLPVVDLGFRRERLGQVATENLTHFFQSLAVALRASLHVNVLAGDNDHHRCEGAFKAVGIGLAMAVELRDGGVASTKGVLV